MSRAQGKLARYRRAAQKAADWLESRQSADGSIDPKGGIASVYKTTFALVTAGRLHAAWRLMDYIAGNYLAEPGEFHGAHEGDADKASAFYRNSYILKAALRLGRFDIASPAALAHYYRYQHRSGGFCNSLKPSGRRRINPLHTAMGGWICLYTARAGRAVRAGDFLIRLIKSQPEMPERFYFHTDARSGRCIAECPAGTGITHFADRHGTRQRFFHSGAIMGYLADLYRATGRAKYLNGALKMFAFERGMNPRGFSWPSKCKVGWGVALLYAATGKAEHRKMAERVADTTFLKAQRRDGTWDEFHAPLRDDGSGFIVSSLEMTAEFTFELCEMVKAMAME